MANMENPLLSQKEMIPQKQSWLPVQGQWTYEDWLKLPDDGYRYEVIDGILHMSPPPRTDHQRISARLVDCLMEYLRSRPLGEVLYTPIGIRLPNQPVPVQPDILFIRAERLDIIKEDYIEGTPDLIMEILSPGNWLYDRRDKMQIYQQAGVAEYWIVDPRASTIEIFVLEEGAYLLVDQYGLEETAQSQVISDFEVSVADIFPG